MDKNKLWKWLLLGVLLLWSAVLIMPPEKKIKLGLDLQGGCSFLLRVDRDDVMKKMVEADDEDELTSVDQIKSSDLDKRVTEVRDVAVEMIRNRVNVMGTEEPEIYPEGDDRIVVRLPGAGAETRSEARNQIQKDGVLTFKLVDVNNEQYVRELMTQPAPDGFAIQNGFYVRDKASLPDDQLTREYYEKLRNHGGYPADLMLKKETLDNGSVVYRPIFVETRPQMGGDSIVDAQVTSDTVTGGWKIALSFDKEGKETFGDITREYAEKSDGTPGRQLAIILDDTLYSAPYLRTPILDGHAEISGDFTLEESRQLVNVLRAGAMPGRVEVIEERTVAPTLGHDSVKSGVKSIIFGGVAVLVFMGVYYLVPGMIANLSLLFVLLLLPVGMVISSGFLGVMSGSLEGGDISLPTLTLYGIAGIVLTVGMAVDANVLTFERMREEWKVGKSVSGAINAGYGKAFSTILDANVTTLLTAIILFWKGSGPIRGFAVTLSAGILVTMFIVLVMTRLFFNTLADGGMLKSIKMNGLAFLQNANFNFVGLRKYAAFISLSLIVLSWGYFFYKGDANFGVDFTGGTVIPFTFVEKQDTDVVREALDKAGFPSAKVDYQTRASGDQFLEVKIGESEDETIQKAVAAVSALKGEYKVDSEDGEFTSIGAQVGSELKTRSIWAIIWSLIGIIIYISIRFEFAFAMGAIVALAHDVLITVGLYCAFGRELSMPIIAALLTIVGYSVNDTIVVFDRIREDLKLVQGKSYKEIANLSINQTLSRTLLTSVTTLLTVVMLLFFGGGAVNDFALALFIGIVVGTYSSIFVATPVVLLWHKEECNDKEVKND